MRAKKEINIQVGSQIRIARESAGLTQEKFAELVSLAPKNVSDIERGVVGVSLSTLKRICGILSVSSDELLFSSKDTPHEINSATSIASRLEKLPRKQFEIAVAVINKLFEAFAASAE